MKNRSIKNQSAEASFQTSRKLNSTSDLLVLDQKVTDESDARSRRTKQLYKRAKRLIQTTQPLDIATARLIVELTNDAINECGTSNQDKKVELKKWRTEAESVLPPRTIKELRERAEEFLIEKGFPKQKWQRRFLLSTIGFGIIVAALAGVYREFRAPTQEQAFVGRITDTTTGSPINGAKLTVEEILGGSQIVIANSDGIAQVTLRERVASIHIKVESNGYEPLDQKILLHGSNIEQIHLKPVQQSQQSPTPLPSPSQQVIKRTTRAGSKTKINRETAKERAYRHLHYRNP